MPLLDDFKDGVVKLFPMKSNTKKGSGGGRYNGGGGVLDEDVMIVSKPAIVFHTIQIFFSFLAMACFASVAGFQAKWKVGPSGLTGFAIFTSIIDMFLSLFLLLIPVIYDKYDKFNRLARALKEDRVAFILVGTGLISMLFISFIVTISAFTEPGCKNPDNDPHAKLGDDFKNGLSGWCDTKKAGAIFLWLTTVAWIASAVHTFFEWRSGKRTRARDPPFIHPENASGYAPSIAPTHDDGDDDDEENDAFRPIQNQTGRTGTTPSRAPYLPPIRGNTKPVSPFADENRAPRQSMDAYAPFSDPEPSGYAGASASPGVSRTMQYADPYAAVKANLAAATAPGHSGSATPPSYEYPGYR